MVFKARQAALLEARSNGIEECTDPAQPDRSQQTRPMIGAVEEATEEEAAEGVAARKCEHCGGFHDGSYGQGRFCCQPCRSKHNGAQSYRAERTGRWSPEEHGLFLKGLELYGKEYKKIAQLVKTRTSEQIRHRAKDHFKKLEGGGPAVPGFDLPCGPGRPSVGDAQEIEWVQCERCYKWRKLPLGESAAALGIDVGAEWHCGLGVWAPNFADCAAPQEPFDEEDGQVITESASVAVDESPCHCCGSATPDTSLLICDGCEMEVMVLIFVIYSGFNIH